MHMGKGSSTRTFSCLVRVRVKLAAIVYRPIHSSAAPLFYFLTRKLEVPVTDRGGKP
jgi:hypothetical protein